MRLRLRPSVDETQRFANELGCEELRPQLQRLMESLGLRRVGAAGARDWSHSNPLLGQASAPRLTACGRSLPRRPLGCSGAICTAKDCALRSACSWKASTPRRTHSDRLLRPASPKRVSPFDSRERVSR